MKDLIAQRIVDLDAPSSDAAEDAQWALIAMGPQVLDDLIAAVPSLGPFGQLCAIEVFTALKDPRTAHALIGLLRSTNSTVREWAGAALAELNIVAAVPHLQRAYDAFRSSGEPPDHSEGAGLRRALTDLGARAVVLPPKTAQLQRPDGTLPPTWPVAHLAEVIEDLAVHGQAVLDFSLWRVGDETIRWDRGPGIEWDVDRRSPWPEIVVHCRDWALLAAADANTDDPDLVAMICWIDRSDL